MYFSSACLNIFKNKDIESIAGSLLVFNYLFLYLIRSLVSYIKRSLLEVI